MATWAVGSGPYAGSSLASFAPREKTIPLAPFSIDSLSYAQSHQRTLAPAPQTAATGAGAGLRRSGGHWRYGRLRAAMGSAGDGRSLGAGPARGAGASSGGCRQLWRSGAGRAKDSPGRGAETRGPRGESSHQAPGENHGPHYSELAIAPFRPARHRPRPDRNAWQSGARHGGRPANELPLPL